MVSAISPVSLASKYSIILATSFGLWVLPISIKAPRLVIMASFVSSMAGFACCFNLATELGSSGRLTRLRQAQERELTEYQFALEEAAIKQQLKLQFFPQPQTVTVAAQALPSQPQAKSPLERKLEKVADLPQHLELILECAIANDGTITARQAMRFKGLVDKHSAEEIKAFFQELQSLELGTVTNDSKRKDSLVFSIAPDILEWVKE